MNSSNTIITGNIAESHLTLTNVQAENRELEVICVATNDHGNPDERDVSITTVGMHTHRYIHTNFITKHEKTGLMEFDQQEFWISKLHK